MLNIFGVSFHLYGLLVGLGIYVGAWVSAKVAEKEKIDPELVWGSLVWVVVFGLIGARLYHVIDLWSYYSVNFGEIIAIWNGGIGIYGGLLGGFFGLNVWIYSRFFSNLKENYKLQITNYKKELLKILDLAAFGLPIGQAIGRWGNYFNQELYGKPTNLPWGIFINPENRLSDVESFSKFHPLFLYESLLNLILFGVMILIYKKSEKINIGSGGFLGMYLVGYGLIRLVLEPLRIGNWVIGNVPMASVFSVVMIVLGITLIFRRTKSEKKNYE